jgi:tetratricopeptide (TPR) repeat protein
LPLRGAWVSRATSAGVVGLAAVAIVALALPYLSLRHVEAALSQPPTAAAKADRDLDRAASLDPLSPDPELARGRIALQRANFPGAERAFRHSLDVEDGWYAHFELALLASRAGRGREARDEIAAARRLNPPDLLVQKAAGLIAQGKRIDPQRVNRENIGLHLYNDPRGH